MSDIPPDATAAPTPAPAPAPAPAAVAPVVIHPPQAPHPPSVTEIMGEMLQHFVTRAEHAAELRWIRGIVYTIALGAVGYVFKLLLLHQGPL